ncbi:TRAP transporter large permease [Herminiimonas fonticola]|uniref:TRAP transporter large permease protein n=1 Tax=Herminiimonas fonticola TaxID=303380 RepID=A0A4R6GHR3_9BURK|nr:TRAP transporter large permease subunit [Herminiimonas fonticola]RBA25405.1 dctM: TRAP transporter, DctM subunit [Herminiimonas fonticola]TDN94519.1 tripartite ATP-independent transporter DctM subunit [Herminiimonas fonticola]
MGTLELGLLYLGVTLVLLFSGMPIAFALGASALGFMYFFMPPMNLELLAETLYGELDNFTLLTIPLFIIMGAAIGKTRAAVDLYESAYRWMHKMPGSLGVANVIGCTVFAALCGSSPATCAAIGGMGIPEMRKRGYSDALATGLIAAGGTLGILIPPSITLIIYGLITEQSIGKLFLAGIIPGLLLAFFFAAYVVYRASKDIRLANEAIAAGNETVFAAPIVENYSWRERFEVLPRLLPFVLLIAVIMYAMYGGIGTPSEIAGIGAFGAMLLVALVYKCYRWMDVRAIFLGTAKESCMIMMIIAMAFLFTYVMSYLRITQSAAEWLAAVEMSKWAYLFWVNILLLVLGCFLPPVAIILMVTPVILPGIIANGFDPIWFGIVLTVNMELGLITPPVGLNLFVIKGISPDIKNREILRGVVPFIFIMMAFIALLAVFPEIVTYLPNKVGS